jgi:ribosomal protein S18 acetylase RimI-like enzyme
MLWSSDLAQHTVSLQLAYRSDAHTIAKMSAALIESGLPPTWTQTRVLWHIKSKESIVLVARSANGLDGFAIMQFGDDTAHLNLLAVSSYARRHGIATQLLSWLHETAIVAGTFVINLEMRANNIEAQSFYRSMGYRELGLIRRYYSGVEDARRMSRDLTVKTCV